MNIIDQAVAQQRRLTGTLKGFWRRLMVQAVQEDLGLPVDDPLDIKQADLVLNHSNIPAHLYEPNKQLLKKRYASRHLLDQARAERWEDERKQHLAETERFDIELMTQNREGLKKLDLRKAKDSQLLDRSMRVLEAEQFLKSTSQSPSNTAELQQKLQAVNEQIKGSERALSPKDAPDDAGYHWGNVETSPARLIRQTNALLDDKRAPPSKERRQELERQLAAAEASVEVHRKRLAELNTERETTLKSLAVSEDAYAPANFEMITEVPVSKDELAKRRAIAAGWHGGGGVTVG